MDLGARKQDSLQGCFEPPMDLAYLISMIVRGTSFATNGRIDPKFYRSICSDPLAVNRPQPSHRCKNSPMTASSHISEKVRHCQSERTRTDLNSRKFIKYESTRFSKL